MTATERADRKTAESVGESRDGLEYDEDAVGARQLERPFRKSTRMPLQYAEKINAARSSMARAAAASRRDECA